MYGIIRRLFSLSTVSAPSRLLPPVQRSTEVTAGDQFEIVPPDPISLTGTSRVQALEQAHAQGVLDGRAAVEAGRDRSAFAIGRVDPQTAEALRRGFDEGYDAALAEQAAISRGLELEQAHLAGYQEGEAAALGWNAKPEHEQQPGEDDEIHAQHVAGLEAGYQAGVDRRAPGAEAAIGYALDPPVNRQNPDGEGRGWAYYCLALVQDAYRAGGNPEAAERVNAGTAIGAYGRYAARGSIRTDGVPPRGALVFFEWGTEGHIGISQGDGTYVGTSPSGYTVVRPYTQGGSKYLGWAAP